MTSEAAQAGLGAALLPSFLVDRELADGSLVALGTPSLPGTGSYYVVVPVERRHQPIIAAFVDWLVAEATTSAFARRKADDPGASPSPMPPG